MNLSRYIRMEELVERLNQAIESYYMHDREIMPNHEYDKLFYELELLESELGVHLDNSPVGTVGYEVVSELRKVTHERPAKSLDKTKSMDELIKWMSGRRSVLSYKMDGLTLIATYREGQLVSAVTRGDGIIGEDVMHNAKYVHGLPDRIPYINDLIVRGEVVISYEDFDVINEQAVASGREPYANPRNLASSSLRLLDSQVARGRRMQFFAFECIGLEDIGSFYGVLDALSGFGLQVVPHVMINDAGLLECEMQRLSDNVVGKTFAYPVDGLVIVYDDMHLVSGLGSTQHHPKWAMAFKWADTEVETVLRNVEWSASRTGLLNPVAVFDSVQLEGTTVSRASVHNLSVLKSLELGIGDTISVYKANMIIPQIADNLTRSNGLAIPEVCPYCGDKLVIDASAKTEVLRCPNHRCPAKQTGKFERMVSKDGLNVVGMSKSIVGTLVSYGYLKRYADLFDLHEYADVIRTFDGYGEKSVEKLLNSIEKARSTTFVRAFCSFGILGCGKYVADTLDAYFGHNEKPKSMAFVDFFKQDDDTVYDSLVLLDGIGEETVRILISWFHENMTEAIELLDKLVITDDVTKPASNDDTGVFLNKMFVISGKLTAYVNRDALKSDIESRGGTVTGSVSKKTDYLICNDTDTGSTKVKKANELGVKVINESEYKKLAGVE